MAALLLCIKPLRYKNIPAYNPTTTKTVKEVRNLEKR